MAVIDDFPVEDFNPYPYSGTFYKYQVDTSKDLDKQEAREVLVYKTDVDIQKRSGSRQANVLGAYYTVYFPLVEKSDATGSVDKYKDCGVRRGHTFRGEFYGNSIEGVVEMVRPSQLGAMSVDIKVITENGN